MNIQDKANLQLEKAKALCIASGYFVVDKNRLNETINAMPTYTLYGETQSVVVISKDYLLAKLHVLEKKPLESIVEKYDGAK